MELKIIDWIVSINNKIKHQNQFKTSINVSKNESF